MATKIHEQLLDDPKTNMISDFDIRGEVSDYVFVAESNEWIAEQLTDRGALITLGSISYWVPKSVMGFTPSGDLWVKNWFYDKHFRP